MTDVEELLRETLTDPRRKLDAVPGLYDSVRDRARDRRHRHATIGAAAGVVAALAVAGSFVGAQLSGRGHGDATATTMPPASALSTPNPGTRPATGTLGAKVSFGTTWEQATAVTIAPSGAIYVLNTNPSQVVLLAPTPNDTDGKYDVKGVQPGPSGTPSGLAVSGNTVWAYSQDSGEIREYNARTLSLIGDIQLGSSQIFQVAALDDNLWFTGSVDGESGLHRLAVGATKPVLIPGVDTSAYGIAADPTRNRILVGVGSDSGSFAGIRLETVDAATLKIEKGGTAAIGKESIAVVHDDVWVAGYGSGETPRVVHFDVNTLQPVGTTAFDAQVGPGAEVVAGMNDLWVQAGGNGTVACVDPASGQVLETWNTGIESLPGSAGGEAFGVVGGAVTHLNLAGSCTG